MVFKTVFYFNKNILKNSIKVYGVVNLLTSLLLIRANRILDNI